MRWQIKSFVFCEDQKTLITEEVSVKLEPMMSELLAYFCRHQNQILSKEQLFNDVWHGRCVSDNTISKLITKLRKALLDDARNPQYIVTVSRRGYRFVANVKQIEENPSSHKENTTSVLANTNYKILLLSLSLFIAAMFLWIVASDRHSPKVSFSAKAITSDKGREYFPSFALEGVRLAYMNYDGEKYRLYVKNIYSGEKVEVDHGEEYGVGPGSWNNAGTKLVYLVASKEKCMYFIREFNDLAMSEPKLIHTCNEGSYGAIKFTHDDNILVFSESAGMGKPYSLYSLNLESGETQWLPQPALHLGGNSQFDLHPTENKLLISSPNEQQWEGFYQLDLETQKLRLLFELNAYICCGIWSHDGEHVVLMGEHPAREIVQYDLNGKNKSLVYVGPQQLHQPQRHSNGIDYTFNASHLNLNVDEYNLEKQETKSILNDTFDERLAVLSPNLNQVAYIGLASGNEELWLYDSNTQKNRKVTLFADSRHYLDLAWSPDQKRIAALTLNAIHVIELSNGETSVLPLPEKEIRGISFKSSSQLAFSMKLGSNWQVVIFNLNNNSMTRLDPKWQSVQFNHLSENWLWVDQDGLWYQGENANRLILPQKNLPAFNGRQFNVKKSGEYIAFYDWQKKRLEVYKNQASKPIVTLDSQVGHFSINGDKVLSSQKSSQTNNSDIYQTYTLSAK